MPDVANIKEESTVVALLARLRTTTRAAHHHIDHHPMLAPLLRPKLSLVHYGMVLGTFFDLYRALQPEIAAAVKHFGGGYELADRLAWLDSDLEYLAKRGCVVSIGMNDLPPIQIDDTAALIGTLYVVEGSALGGQVIARYLQASLGVDDEGGARFFNGRCAETLLHWNRFQQFAATLCPPEKNEEAAVASVVAFDYISHALDEAWARHSAYNIDPKF